MSTHHQKYLYEAGLTQPFKFLQEMSAASFDASDNEAGLEPDKKKRIKGLLPTGEYQAVKFEKLEGPHGEPEYDQCENCLKQIRYAVTIVGPEDSHIVGADCAIALTTGETQSAIIAYVSDEKKKIKFIKQSLAKIKEHCDFYGNPAADRYKYYGKDFTVWDMFNEAVGMGINTYKDMALFLANRGPVKIWNFIASKISNPSKSDVINMQLIFNTLAYRLLLDKHAEALAKALDDALKSNKTLRNKNFFFEPNYGYVDFITEFGLDEIIATEKINI